jgi:hypothetical protein
MANIDDQIALLKEHFGVTARRLDEMAKEAKELDITKKREKTPEWVLANLSAVIAVYESRRAASLSKSAESIPHHRLMARD